MTKASSFGSSPRPRTTWMASWVSMSTAPWKIWMPGMRKRGFSTSCTMNGTSFGLAPRVASEAFASRRVSRSCENGMCQSLHELRASAIATSVLRHAIQDHDLLPDLLRQAAGQVLHLVHRRERHRIVEALD